MQKATLFLAVTLTLSGCASMFQKYPVADSPHIQDQTAIKRAAYMVRYLLPADERMKLEGQVRKDAPTLFPEYAGVAARTALFGALDTSTLGGLTEGGVALGLKAAGALIDAFGPDGSTWLISDLYVPAQADGTIMDSPDTVRIHARRTLIRRLRTFAKQEGYQLRCMGDCHAKVPVFAIHGPKDKDGNDRPFVVLFVFNEPIKLKPDPIRDAILGFHPAWNANAVMITADDIATDDDGNVIRDNNGFPTKTGLFALYSPVGHKLLRALTRNGDFVYGINYAYSNVAAVRGRLFHVNFKRADDFIDFEWK